MGLTDRWRDEWMDWWIDEEWVKMERYLIYHNSTGAWVYWSWAAQGRDAFAEVSEQMLNMKCRGGERFRLPPVQDQCIFISRQRRLGRLVEVILYIFLWNPRAFWPCIDSNADTTLKAQKGSKDIINSPCDIRGSTLMLWSYEHTLCAQKTNDFIKKKKNLSPPTHACDFCVFLTQKPVNYGGTICLTW